MHSKNSLSWVVSLSLVAGVLTAPAVRADSSFSDITGTNIWNNTAPIFDTDNQLDPKLIESVIRINQQSETAYRACDNAISQLEQNRRPAIRQFLRDSSNVSVAPPETPAACLQLEQLRVQADSLRRAVEEANRSRTNSALLTW